MSPAITDTMFYLGVNKELIAVSQFCNDRKRGLPRVGTPFTPSYERIVKLRPNLVLTQPIKDSKFYNFMKKLKLKVEQYPFNSLDEIRGSIVKMAKEFKSSKGVTFELELSTYKKKLKAKKIKGNFYAVLDIKGGVDQFKGLILAAKDSYLSEVVELTGLENKAPFKSGYKEVGIEKFLRSQVDHLIVFNRSPEITSGKIKDYLRNKLKMKKVPQVTVFNQSYVVVPGPGVINLMEDVANVL